jgi:hypothetical protein
MHHQTPPHLVGSWVGSHQCLCSLDAVEDYGLPILWRGSTERLHEQSEGQPGHQVVMFTPVASEHSFRKPRLVTTIRLHPPLSHCNHKVTGTIHPAHTQAHVPCSCSCPNIHLSLHPCAVYTDVPPLPRALTQRVCPALHISCISGYGPLLLKW